MKRELKVDISSDHALPKYLVLFCFCQGLVGTTYCHLSVNLENRAIFLIFFLNYKF